MNASDNFQSPIFNHQSPILTDLPRVALSIRQPWAWLIVNGHKTIENRSRNIGNIIGPILIHASSRMTRDDYGAAILFVSTFSELLAEEIPDFDEFHMGGIVGMADIIGHGNMEMVSPWWTGPYAYSLENARPLPFQSCKGQLGFFECHYEVGTVAPRGPSGGAQ
jgi:hypothetical protein